MAVIERLGLTATVTPKLKRFDTATLLNKHLAIARLHCSSLVGKHVTPHVLRHSLAMNLLHHGADRSVIALWLGHESVETISIYYRRICNSKKRRWPRPPPPMSVHRATAPVIP